MPLLGWLPKAWVRPNTPAGVPTHALAGLPHAAGADVGGDRAGRVPEAAEAGTLPQVQPGGGGGGRAGLHGDHLVGLAGRGGGSGQRRRQGREHGGGQAGQHGGEYCETGFHRSPCTASIASTNQLQTLSQPAATGRLSGPALTGGSRAGADCRQAAAQVWNSFWAASSPLVSSASTASAARSSRNAELLALGRGQLAQHVVGRVLAPRRPADAEPDPQVLLGPQRRAGGLQAVVAALATAALEPQAAERQVELVVHDDDPLEHRPCRTG